ncbi:MAG: hypothetical protein JW793_14835 [Acidobacteria bacterium]|nr:hypothetical protein [Acidobacteriota bacterium]
MDAGDLLNEDEEIRDTVMEAAKIKADSMVRIFGHIGADAVNVGEKDLALGVPFLKELEKKYNFPFVSANLTDAEGTPVFKRYIIKDVAGKKVGIFGLMGDMSEMVDKVQNATGGTVKVQDALEAAAAVVAELSGKTDYMIVLAHQKANRDWVLARRVEGIDLIIGGQDYLKTENPKRAGETLMVNSGEKGQYQGLLEVTLNGEKTAQNSLIPFGDKIGDDPEVKAMVAEYNDKIVALYGSGPDTTGASVAAPAVLRVASCEPCHSEVVRKWRSTDHAKAYSTLVGKSKQFDPSCLVCHTTRFEKSAGFTMSRQQPELMNVQCESCHGDATEHLSSMKPIPVADPPVELCIECHTPDRCPGFDREFDEAWMKIAH